MQDTTSKCGERSVSRRWSTASKTRRFGDGGQTLLEFALLLPVLCLLSVGIVELGRAAYISIIVTNAATAGVEYGSQNSNTAVDVNGMQTAAMTDASNNTIGGTMSATATYGCYCDTSGTSGISCTYQPNGQDCTGSNPNSCSCGSMGTSCAAPSQIVTCVQVVTQDTFNPLFSYPGLPTSFQSNGKSVMRVR